jgi:hypothetical protein
MHNVLSSFAIFLQKLPLTFNNKSKHLKIQQ